MAVDPGSPDAGAGPIAAMAQDSGRLLRRLALVALGLAMLVVVLGAYTRLADAGLGCPDWPGCYGHLGVPQGEAEVALAESRFPDAPVEADKAWIEMVHRYFASALGLLILVIVALSWRVRRRPPALPLALAGLVILQGAFGAWTVTLKLWPQVVTAHLLGGFATLALVWWLCLSLGGGPQGPAWAQPGRAISRLVWVTLALTILQVALGGWVTSNYAALACADFPTCHGDWLPSMDFRAGFNFFQSVGPNYLGGMLDSEARIAIQFAHRAGAVLVLLSVGWLGYRLWRAENRLAPWLLGLLAIQLTLGVLNVLLALPLAVATAHNAGGALLLLALVTLRFHLSNEDSEQAGLD